MKDTSSIPPVDSQQTIALHIENLVAFALHNGLIQTLDTVSARNTLLDLFDLKEPAEGLGFIKADSLPESPVPLL
jgi:UDPglucose--hexose-1-phosphate uridylyltransferase